MEGAALRAQLYIDDDLLTMRSDPVTYLRIILMAELHQGLLDMQEQGRKLA